MQHIAIVTAKRGARRGDASVVDAFKVVETIGVPENLSALHVREYPPHAVNTLEDARVEVHIPTVVFPLGSSDPVEFMQTVTSCGSSRPLMNKDDVCPSKFFTQLYNGRASGIDLSTPHAILIAPLRGRRAVVVVPEEHDRAASLLGSVSHLLPTIEGRPFVVRNTVITGDGLWTKSQWHLSSSLFELIFDGCDTVLSRTSDFYKPSGRRNNGRQPARAPATTGSPATPPVSGVVRPRDEGSTSTTVVTQNRVVRPRRMPLGLGKGLMAPIHGPERPDGPGMHPRAVDEIVYRTVVRAVMNDAHSDPNDVVYAVSAITTVRSHLDDAEFSQFMRNISTVGEEPLTSRPRPAECVSEVITDVVRHYDPAIIDALNMLADTF